MSRVRVNGRVFLSAREVFAWAVKKRKFKGTIGTIQRRLSRGERTWKGLLAPLRPYGNRNRDPKAAKAAMRELSASMAALKAIRPVKPRKAAKA